MFFEVQGKDFIMLKSFSGQCKSVSRLVCGQVKHLVLPHGNVSASSIILNNYSFMPSGRRLRSLNHKIHHKIPEYIRAILHSTHKLKLIIHHLIIAETKGNMKHGINKTCVANFRLSSLYQAIQMIQQEIAVARQQPEM
jgi:hypothetical protein